MVPDKFCRVHGNIDLPCPECYVALEDRLKSLAAHIERVVRERDEARAEAVSLKRHHQLVVIDLEIDRARAATVLRQIEWILPPDICPICYGAKQDGHAFECALKVALADVSEGEVVT